MQILDRHEAAPSNVGWSTSAQQRPALVNGQKHFSHALSLHDAHTHPSVLLQFTHATSISILTIQFVHSHDPLTKTVTFANDPPNPQTAGCRHIGNGSVRPHLPFVGHTNDRGLPWHRGPTRLFAGFATLPAAARQIGKPGTHSRSHRCRPAIQHAAVRPGAACDSRRCAGTCIL